MTAAEVAQTLKAKKSGQGWSACCPAHDDSNASLSITEGRDGRTLLHCHAGCKFDEVIAAAGLSKSDLKPPRRERARPETVATYDYTDAAGKLLFQVCRMVPKSFRQRRPDGNGGWHWNMKGVQRVLYRLPQIEQARNAGRIVFVCEGEKDCNALAGLGLVATCNAGGAGKWETGYTESLTGCNVIILPDLDPPGRKHAALVRDALRGKAQTVRVVELPKEWNGRPVKDAADWLQAGGTKEELARLVKAAPEWEPPAASQGETGKPVVLLPGAGQTINESAKKLGALLAKTREFYLRGGVLTRLNSETAELEEVKPAALASFFEQVATLAKGEEFAPAICAEGTARLIAAADTFRKELPPISLVSACPVLAEIDGELITITGYNRQAGIMATGEPVVEMNSQDAAALLHEVLDGFQFATEADRARALAAMITPALVFGGLLNGRAPADLGEADHSQTGKGYRNKLTAAIYGQTVRAITQRKGGSGSLEESFNSAVMKGANFIALDNLRGRIDSPAIESFQTEDSYSARAPYREPIEIDPRRTIIMLTSNKADLTTDLANRCSCVKLLKQPAGHAFKRYPEGDILGHVRANQPRFLGAVFAIVREWHKAGKQATIETRHDFREWAGPLNWICQNLLGTCPILDGHRETQERMTNPALNWLRDVAILILQEGRAGQWLRANHILDLLLYSEIEVPGITADADAEDADTRRRLLQSMGRKLGQCFRSGDFISIDSMRIERREGYDTEGRATKEYQFNNPPKESDDQKRIAGKPDSIAGNADTEPGQEVLLIYENELSPYGPAIEPAIKPAIKSTIPAIPADTSKHIISQSEESKEGDDIIICSEPLGGIGGIAGTVEYEEGEI